MKQIIEKIVEKASANWAINTGAKSNETNIKITQEIANLFGVKISNDVEFNIFKEDFIKSLCCIIGHLPLARSGTGKIQYFSQDIFNEDLKAIEDFFGSDKTKKIKATLAKPESHSMCLNFGSGNFSIREFLLERHSRLIFQKDKNNEVSVRVEFKHDIENNKKTASNGVELKLQQIYYGAPGTGKSKTIKLTTKQMPKDNVFRTTFHPDTDYASFVGCYKPTMSESRKKQRMNLSFEDLAKALNTYYVKAEKGEQIKGLQKFCYEYEYYIDGEYMNVNIPTLLKHAGIPNSMKCEVDKYMKFMKLYPKQPESMIVYSFVPQIFLKAYLKAWKNTTEKVVLVIEEINRGNCAQIFGDLFQLLDRNDGFSEYPIDCDSDLKRALENEFRKFNKPSKDIITSINKQYSDHYSDAVEQIWSGNIMVLPNNLYIWATMNTSDQSLFPIDSAFKRRWEWKYVPICNANKGYYISVNGKKYDWWNFLEEINKKIEETTSSEDKKMGYFFCKAKDDGCISAETFVGKVLFYIWNDVFKDYGFDDAIFKDAEGKELKFHQFFNADGSANEDMVERFLNNLKLSPVFDTASGDAKTTAAEEEDLSSEQ